MPRRPLLRKDAFFGLHFDLHPSATDTVLGAEIEEAHLLHLLDRVRPDYVQYDCKGHEGYTGYPTEVGWPSPGIVKDSLALWRVATRARGVGLYIHYSGVWDMVAIEHHPEWARIASDGTPDKNATSTFGPYVDELLIPQLKEVTARYQLDGAWVDGECWATQLDYSPAALAQWRLETGEEDAPTDRTDPRWLAWKQFHRRQFERYLCHWVDALHAFNPRLQLTSNWMYSTFAPVPVAANLDFLSGDYPHSGSADKARLEARYLASTGKPWDLMAWGFNNMAETPWNQKTAIQLQQEASVVLMQGGGMQVYNEPTRSGYIDEQVIETLGQVADYCRARQKVSHRSTSVPQVALLLSWATQSDQSDAVFHSWGGGQEVEGALHALLELHYSVDVLAEHQLQPRLAEYPLVVIPDSYRLEAEFVEALLAYVRQGGALLLLGERCARLFAAELGVTMVGEPEESTAYVGQPGDVMTARGLWHPVTLTGAEAVGLRWDDLDTRKSGHVAATEVRVGQGKIGAIFGPAALNFFRTHHPSLRRFIGRSVSRLFPDPAVQVEAPPNVDVALRRTRDGKLSLHLLNLAEAQRSDHFLNPESIPAVGPIEVRLRLPERPARVRCVPEGGRVKWSWEDGTLCVSLPRLVLHSVLVVEPATVTS